MSECSLYRPPFGRNAAVFAYQEHVNEDHMTEQGPTDEDGAENALANEEFEAVEIETAHQQGLRPPRRRDPSREITLRAKKRQAKRTFALEWETCRSGELLVLYQATKLKAKNRWESYLTEAKKCSPAQVPKGPSPL